MGHVTDAQQLQKNLQETAAYLRERLGPPPPVAVVLGSGLGEFIEDLPDREVVDYAEIPNFPVSSVVGHAGRLCLARQQNQLFFVAMQGRVHLYEGLPAWKVVFAVRALALWGVGNFIITNAAGAVNTDYEPGELMLIRDHINLLGDNPLRGANLEALGERFPDMTRAYSYSLRQLARSVSGELGLKLREGVYAAVLGPSYETPAEIRMLRTAGADAVGMSTVPEVIALSHLRKKVLGISCITNMAAGIRDERMRHEDVLETTALIKKDFTRLILALLKALSHG